MWKPFIEWGAAMFGAALAVTKLVETSRTFFTKANERGYFDKIKHLVKK